MYKEFLKDAPIPHYGHTDIFGEHSSRWVHAFIKTHYNIDMHSQAFYEINIIVKGEGMHYIESKRIAIQKGDIFIIPPGVRHGYCSNDELDVYHVLLHQLFLTQYVDELQTLPYFSILFHIEPMMRTDGSLNLHLKIDDEELVHINALLQNLLEWTVSSSLTYTTMSRCTALILIVQFCDYYHKHHLKALPEKKTKLDTDFMKSISFIYDHYDQKIHIDQLAKMAFLSKNVYINRFKKIMHTTPATFIRDYRIKKTRELLVQSDKSLLDTALQTGFFDVSHFSKCFKKATGCSPAAYRNKYKQSNRPKKFH